MRSSSRSGFLAFTVVTCAATAAWAQHCQPSLEAPDAALVLSGRIGVETASYRNPRFEGNWSGLITEVGGSVGRWHGRAWLGGYQLERNGLRAQGWGDVGLELRATAFASPDATLRAGPALAITLPTGDAASGLGMGHAMAMPGFWAVLLHGRLGTGALVSFGRALASDSGHHHHGAGSIVDPMNATEIMAHARLGWTWASFLRSEATGSYAQPIGGHGDARGIAGLGLVVTTRPVDLGVTVQRAVVGEPFRLRALLSAAVQL